MLSRRLATVVAITTLALTLLTLHQVRFMVMAATPLLVGPIPILTAPRAVLWANPDLQALATDDGRLGTMVFLLFLLAIVGVFGALYHVRRRRQERKASELMAMIKDVERTPALEPGEAYLIIQGRSKALKVFEDELHKGHRGLCISRTHPTKLKETMDLKNATVVWLSREEANGDLLQDISVRVSRFVYSRNRGVVLLDGLEYLIVHHDFPQVLKFLQRIKDMLAAKGAKLLLPIDLHALVENQRAQLTREFRQL